MPELVLSVPGRTGPVCIHSNRLLTLNVKATKGMQRQKAGLLVSHPSGWKVYPLPCTYKLTLNQMPLSAPAVLSQGDVLTYGKNQLHIVRAQSDGVSADALVAPSCQIEVKVGTESYEANIHHSPFFIGSHPSCHLPIAQSTIQPQHVMLTYADSLWFVNDLTGQRLERLSTSKKARVRSSYALSGEVMWIGAMQLIVRCQPLDRIGSTQMAALPVPESYSLLGEDRSRIRKGTASRA